MNKCTKGLHEMTEANTYLDRYKRRHCRECQRNRKREYRRAPGRRQLVAHHKAETFSLKRTAMDEALEKNPPIITWRRKPGGVWVKVEVIDPHAEPPHNPVRHQAQIEAYERKRRDAA